MSVRCLINLCSALHKLNALHSYSFGSYRDRRRPKLYVWKVFNLIVFSIGIHHAPAFAFEVAPYTVSCATAFGPTSGVAPLTPSFGVTVPSYRSGCAVQSPPGLKKADSCRFLPLSPDANRLKFNSPIVERIKLIAC
jgi:hypothetical protein